MTTTLKPVDITKWVATFIQLIGYGLTGLSVVPYFAVGYMWKDRAISMRNAWGG